MADRCSVYFTYRTGVEIPLDVMLSSLGYGAALLCSSASDGRKCDEAGVG